MHVPSSWAWRSSLSARLLWGTRAARAAPPFRLCAATSTSRAGALAAPVCRTKPLSDAPPRLVKDTHAGTPLQWCNTQAAAPGGLLQQWCNTPAAAPDGLLQQWCNTQAAAPDGSTRRQHPTAYCSSVVTRRRQHPKAAPDGLLQQCASRWHASTLARVCKGIHAP